MIFRWKSYSQKLFSACISKLIYFHSKLPIDDILPDSLAQPSRKVNILKIQESSVHMYTYSFVTCSQKPAHHIDQNISLEHQWHKHTLLCFSSCIWLNQRLPLFIYRLYPSTAVPFLLLFVPPNHTT